MGKWVFAFVLLSLVLDVLALCGIKVLGLLLDLEVDGFFCDMIRSCLHLAFLGPDGVCGLTLTKFELKKPATHT